MLLASVVAGRVGGGGDDRRGRRSVSVHADHRWRRRRLLRTQDAATCADRRTKPRRGCRSCRRSWRFSSRRVSAPLLTDIRRRLDTKGAPPSRQIARLQRLIDYLNNSLRNQFFAPIAFVLGLPVHLVHAIEVWRGEVGPHIPDWLRAVGEFEALACLAGFAFERPEHPFPKSSRRDLLRGRQIGHPLIPPRQCVHNVCLDEKTRLILISGSNMSGKSTMLRTIGTNLVLAQAGTRSGPKRLDVLGLSSRHGHADPRFAAKRRITVLRGRQPAQSRRRLVAAAAVPCSSSSTKSCREPIRTTGSIGSEGVFARLVTRGAIGLDDDARPGAHRAGQPPRQPRDQLPFRGFALDGKMTFDYRIRSGVVQKSNALESCG